MMPYRITNQTGYHESPLSAIITAKDPPSLGLIYTQIALPGLFFSYFALLFCNRVYKRSYVPRTKAYWGE